MSPQCCDIGVCLAPPTNNVAMARDVFFELPFGLCVLILEPTSVTTSPQCCNIGVCLAYPPNNVAMARDLFFFGGGLGRTSSVPHVLQSLGACSTARLRRDILFAPRCIYKDRCVNHVCDKTCICVRIYLFTFGAYRRPMAPVSLGVDKDLGI